MELLNVFVAALILGLIGAAIGQSRGRVDAGFLWGFFLGPLGWLIVLLGPNPKKQKEDSERRSQEQKIERLQQQHVAELKTLRESVSATRVASAETREDMFWVQLKDKEVGPIGRLEVIELFAGGKISLETMVALETGAPTRYYKLLGEEMPALRSLKPTN